MVVRESADTWSVLDDYRRADVLIATNRRQKTVTLPLLSRIKGSSGGHIHLALQPVDRPVIIDLWRQAELGGYG